MNGRTELILTAALALLLLSTPVEAKKPVTVKPKGTYMGEKIVKTDAEWKKLLTAEQFEVLRKHGTEKPFTGKDWNNHENGEYVCAACGLELFASDAKFESGTGWPSFFQPIHPENVGTKSDNTFFMRRTEVHCPRCGGHLGHVFEDGPKPTGLRYCMNSAAMNFVPAKLKK